MKRLLILTFILVKTIDLSSQNVGIGIASPQAKLHLYSAFSPAGIRVETNSTGDEASLEIKTNGGLYDFLEIRKYPSFYGGSIAGIALNDLSLIRTGAGANGGLMLGTTGSFPLYFISSNVERMRLTETGTVAIGNTSPSASAIMDIQSSSKGVLFPRMSQSNRNSIINPDPGLLVFQNDIQPGLYSNLNTASLPVWKKLGEVPSYPTAISNSARYTAYGEANFTVPPGVFRIFFEMAAAGGGAGGNYTGGSLNGGGGGGGGGFAKGYINVVPGEILNIFIGTPGMNGNSSTSPSPGIAAEPCYILSNSVSLINVEGGFGGLAGSSSAPGNGGSGGGMTYNNSRVVLTTRAQSSAPGRNGKNGILFAGEAGFVYSTGEHNYLSSDQIMATATINVSFTVPKPHYGKGGGPFAQPTEGYVVLFW